MHFEINNIYHIYNQGNNRQRIFFRPENYVFFMKKIETHIIPYTDIIAFCLMPNHFHLLVQLRVLDSHGVTLSHAVTTKARARTFNDSIGIMLRSYTRAVNKQNDRSGKLFREATKAECISAPDMKSSLIAPDLISGNDYDDSYLKTCFHYIHQNPVKAGLVYHEADWEFSSAFDFAGYRSNSFVNKNLAEDLGLILAYSSDDSKSSDE